MSRLDNQLEDLPNTDGYAEDVLSAEAVTLYIIPGLPAANVVSGYSLDTVNDLSTKIIRIALALFCIQALVQIALAVWVIRIDAIITSAINIFFFLMIFYLAVRCVKGRNATVCCGCRALDLYRLYIMVALFVLLLNVLGSIAMIIHDPLLGSIALVVYSTLFTLNSLELYYSNKLIKELNTSVRPEKSIMVPAQASAQQTNVPLAEVQFVHTV